MTDEQQSDVPALPVVDFGRRWLREDDKSRPEFYKPLTREYILNLRDEAARGVGSAPSKNQATEYATAAAVEGVRDFLDSLHAEPLKSLLDGLRWRLAMLYKFAPPSVFRSALVETVAAIYPQEVPRRDGATAVQWWMQEGSEHPVCAKSDGSAGRVLRAWDDGLWSTKALAQLVGTQRSGIYSTLDRYRPGWRGLAVDDDLGLGDFAQRFFVFQQNHGMQACPNEFVRQHADLAEKYAPTPRAAGEDGHERLVRKQREHVKRYGDPDKRANGTEGEVAG